MAKRLFCDIFVLSLIIHLVSSAADHWSYTAQNDWPKLCKTGVRQSPIDIQTKRAALNTSLIIETKRYDQPIYDFNITNNGHTAQLSIDVDDALHPYITGIALEHQEYKFAQLHFHWSGQVGRGSEHAINNHLYSMEMHLVHFNKKYDNISEAINHSDGLAVIGVLFQIKRKDNPHLDAIIQGVTLTRVQGMGDYTNTDRDHHSGQPKVVLKDLLPNDMETFFRYKGSLTTPPCAESVTWLVYHDTTDIGLSQIKKFRELVNINKVLLSDTFRQIQPTNDRRIETSRTVKDSSGLSAHLSSNSVITQLSIIASLLMLAKY